MKVNKLYHLFDITSCTPHLIASAYVAANVYGVPADDEQVSHAEHAARHGISNEGNLPITHLIASAYVAANLYGVPANDGSPGDVWPPPFLLVFIWQ